jgi:nuclear pore complex protein Nup85
MLCSSHTLSAHPQVHVHKGFMHAYSSVRPVLLQLLGKMVADGKLWRVYVTGHSLGGALATLCALDLSSRR